MPDPGRPRRRGRFHGSTVRGPRRRGVVGVIVQTDRLLVIRRSLTVRAPGMHCFPGGGLEPGESEPDALVREMHEELNIATRPVERLWESDTRSGVRLGWWLTELLSPDLLQANPAEVAEIHWLPVADILALETLLDTNRRFFEAWTAGHFELPLPR
ncbi:MAG: NUDIX domain-containing protein [Pirellulales bacterium]